MNDDEIGRKLDLLITINKIAFRDAIERVGATIREDKVNLAILNATKRWASPAQIHALVVRKNEASKRTVARRTEELLALGALEKQGGGPTTEYRSTGVI
jgi:hypothetical protein